MVGYDPKFLADNLTLPLPGFNASLAGNVLNKPELEEGILANYINYTIITNKVRRSAILAALNIDQNLLKSVRRDDNWRIDTRIGAEFQLNNDYYRRNPWDRGHLARRASTAWGQTEREAKQASDDTFFYSNASLQHENFNQDEWLALENWVFNLNLDSNGKISVFSGPIYGESPRTITPEGRDTALIPTAFFKVVCFINKDTNELDVRAFIMFQDREALADKRGHRMIDFQRYQVTISEIEQLTGLDFDDNIYEKNPLLFNENEEARERLNINFFPERIEVDEPEELIDAEQPRDFIADDEVSVFIAAAMVNPAGKEEEGEWVSIINLSNDSINLEGWSISDMKREPLNLTDVLDKSKIILQAGEAVRIQPITPVRLSNKGGVIALYDKPQNGQTKGRRIDRVHYSKDDAKQQGIPLTFFN